MPEDFAKGEGSAYVTEWGWLTPPSPRSQSNMVECLVSVSERWLDGRTDPAGSGGGEAGGLNSQQWSGRAAPGATRLWARSHDRLTSTLPLDLLTQCCASSCFWGVLSLFSWTGSAFSYFFVMIWSQIQPCFNVCVDLDRLMSSFFFSFCPPLPF